MTGGTGLLVLVIAIVVAVIISQKFDINIGILGFLMAIVVGWFLEVKPQNILAYFPSNLFMLLLSTTVFFGFVSQTDVFSGVCNRILYQFRHVGWAVPWVLLLACYAVAVIGAGNYGTPALMSPLAFGMAAACGFSPVLAAAIVWIGSTLSGLWPWESKYLTLQQLLTTSLGEEGAGQALFLCIIVQHILFFAVFAGCYFITKGYKAKPIEHMEKPAPFTPNQKKALILLVVFFAFLCVPTILKRFIKSPVLSWITTYLDIRTLCLLFAVIFHICKLGDMKTVLAKKVPWGTILKSIGMCTLAALAAEIGLVDTLSNFVENYNLPAFVITPVLIISCAALGAVTDGLSVVAVLFIPIATVLAPVCGVAAPAMAACIYSAANCTSVSPLSIGGNMATIGASDEQRESGLFNKQFIYCGAQVLLFVFAGFIQLWAITGSILGYW